jgi:hypothetical protein
MGGLYVTLLKLESVKRTRSSDIVKTREEPLPLTFFGHAKFKNGLCDLFICGGGRVGYNIDILC